MQIKKITSEECKEIITSFFESSVDYGSDTIKNVRDTLKSILSVDEEIDIFTDVYFYYHFTIDGRKCTKFVGLTELLMLNLEQLTPQQCAYVGDILYEHNKNSKDLSANSNIYYRRIIDITDEEITELYRSATEEEFSSSLYTKSIIHIDDPRNTIKEQIDIKSNNAIILTKKPKKIFFYNTKPVSSKEFNSDLRILEKSGRFNVLLHAIESANGDVIDFALRYFGMYDHSSESENIINFNHALIDSIPQFDLTDTKLKLGLIILYRKLTNLEKGTLNKENKSSCLMKEIIKAIGITVAVEVGGRDAIEDELNYTKAHIITKQLDSLVASEKFDQFVTEVLKVHNCDVGNKIFRSAILSDLWSHDGKKLTQCKTYYVTDITPTMISFLALAEICHCHNFSEENHNKITEDINQHLPSHLRDKDKKPKICLNEHFFNFQLTMLNNYRNSSCIPLTKQNDFSTRIITFASSKFFYKTPIIVEAKKIIKLEKGEYITDTLIDEIFSIDDFIKNKDTISSMGFTTKLTDVSFNTKFYTALFKFISITLLHIRHIINDEITYDEITSLDKAKETNIKFACSLVQSIEEQLNTEKVLQK